MAAMARLPTTASFTVTVTSALAESALSFAVRRSTYVPAAENDAVVTAADALPKLTVPGPEIFVHSKVSAPGGFGKPSSVAVPCSEAWAGSVMVRAGPALTTGAWLTISVRRSASMRK